MSRYFIIWQCKECKSIGYSPTTNESATCPDCGGAMRAVTDLTRQPRSENGKKSKNCVRDHGDSVTSAKDV